MQRVSWILLSLVLLSGLSACAGIEEKKDAQLLDSRMAQYGKVLRWSHFEDAYGFLKLAPGEVIKVPKDIENIRITSYEVYIPPVKTDEKTALQTVKILYLHKDRQVLKTLIDEQIWTFDDELENWYRSNPMPDFE